MTRVIEALEERPRSPGDVYVQEATAVVVAEAVAYVALSGRILAYDVADPEAPVFLGGTATIADRVMDLCAVGKHVYAVASDWGPVVEPKADAQLPAVHADPLPGPGVVAFDFTDPGNPVVDAWQPVDSGAEDLALSGSRLYVAAQTDGVVVLDVSVPGSLALSGSIDVRLAGAVVASPEYLYVADPGDQADAADGTPTAAASPGVDTPTAGAADAAHPELLVYDVIDPSVGGAQLVSRLDLATPVRRMALTDGYVLLANTRGLLSVDVADPSQPALGAFHVGESVPMDVRVVGSFAYVAEQDKWGNPFSAGLEVFDISDPDQMERSSWQATGRGALALDVSGTYLYLASGDGLRVLAMTNPAEPTLVAGPDVTRSWLGDIVVDGNFAYVIDWFGELRIYDVGAPSGTHQVGSVWLDTDHYPSEGALAVADGYAYVMYGYALFVVDVRSPSAPVRLGLTPPLDWRRVYGGCVSVAGDYAYVDTFGNGVFIIDVSEPLEPTVNGMIDDVQPEGNVARDGYLYVASTSGLHSYDVSDPWNPVETAVSDLGPVHRPVVSGDRLYALTSGSGLAGYDLSDPAHPSVIAEWDYPSVAVDMLADGGRLYLGVEAAGVDVLDVATPFAPETGPPRVGSVGDPPYAFGIAVTGGTLHVVHGDGYRITDITDVEHPKSVFALKTPG